MPSPRLRLMPTTAIMDTVLPTMDMDTAWPTTATATATLDMAMPTLMPTDTTMARGLLMLRLSPLLMLTTVMLMDTVWPTTDTDMPTMVTTTARGPLMPSPLLMLTTVIIMAMLHTDMLTV